MAVVTTYPQEAVFQAAAPEVSANPLHMLRQHGTLNSQIGLERRIVFFNKLV